MKFIMDGGVAISCGCDGKDLVAISETIKNQLGKDYEVIIPQKKCPKVKIVNIEGKLLNDREDFIDKIVLQNAINTDMSHRKISVITHYKGNQGKESVILEVDPNTYSLMQKKDRLSIGWKSYKFFDHINVKQCFKCYKFGHLAKECKSETVICAKCAGNHKIGECQSNDVRCANCKYAAEVLKIPNVSFDHHGYDKKCAAYKRIYNQIEQKIYYPNNIYPSQK